MDSSTEMRVLKRNGELQDIAFDKILFIVNKIDKECSTLYNQFINNNKLKDYKKLLPTFLSLNASKK